jgi:hypothetical protein
MANEVLSTPVHNWPKPPQYPPTPYDWFHFVTKVATRLILVPLLYHVNAHRHFHTHTHIFTHRHITHARPLSSPCKSETLADFFLGTPPSLLAYRHPPVVHTQKEAKQARLLSCLIDFYEGRDIHTHMHTHIA